MKTPKMQRRPCSALEVALANSLTAVRQEIENVLKTDQLPDGDHINQPTRLWLESLKERRLQ